MRWEYYDDNIISKERVVTTMYTSKYKAILVAGCKEIEKNYLEQVEEIREVIG